MTTHPPPYATAPPSESKGLYPSVGTDPAMQQPQQPSVAYHAQPAGTPGYYYPQQQQPQQVYITPQPPTVVVAPAAPVKSYVAHIVVSCIVFWCCGCLCGLIAFIFVMIAHSQSDVSPSSARTMGITSIVFSVIGIIGGIVLYILLILYLIAGGLALATATAGLSTAECPHYMNGKCYDYKLASISEDYCRDILSNGIDYYYSSDNYCYYN